MKARRRTKTALWIGAGLMALALLVAALIFISSSMKNNRFLRHYEAAQHAHSLGDYETAALELEDALKIKATEAAYLLLADCYVSQGQLDKAIEVLYVGSYRLGSEAVSLRLEKLKREKATLNEINATGRVTVGDVTVLLTDTVLLLSGKGLGDEDIVSVAMLSSLTSLSLNGNSITDLTPLRALYGLDTLNLSDNLIHDLTPIEGLSGLKTLYLDGNPITNFEPLKKLTGLTTLSLKGIAINSLQLEELRAALPGCAIFTGEVEVVLAEITLGGATFRTDVTELDLSSRKISDISELSKCPDLTKLDLRDNDIADLSALVDLQNLKWLCLWNNQVSDLGPLFTLSGLAYLDLDSNQVTDISILAALPQLQELWLSGNQLKQLATLSQLTDLRRLGLKNTGLTDADLEILAKLTKLTELNIEENDGLTKAAVDKLKASLPGCEIKHSELSYTVTFGQTVYKADTAVSITAPGANVSSLAGLERFDFLQNLELGQNRVTDLSPLSGLAALRTLGLGGNGLADISPLSGLTGLTKLDLSDNGIRDLAALSKLTALTELNLNDNMAADLTALSGLSRLQILCLDNNRVDDVAPLLTLTGLRQLYISGNGLSEEQYLQLRNALPNCALYCDGYEDLYG